MRDPHVAVVGSGRAEPAEIRLATDVGRALAERGATVVCGGLGGVMEAACRGASDAGGTSIGILPGADRREANHFVSAAIATGMGEARNALVVRTADALIAVGGEFGTLSEIALALKAGKQVVGLGTWELGRGDRAVLKASSAQQAVDQALRPHRMEPSS